MNDFDLAFFETKADTKLRVEALNAAIFVTASEHEWKWTHEQQVAMARFCCDASKRLCELQRVVERLEQNEALRLPPED